ncbi:hypothetical protein HY622_03585 [Candidatus Uhrbacteria bacterium]|nr:hypothetical protein [Candidatus Uhrbacteria bacterium]
MQAFSVELDNLPEHIREFILSEEYFEFLFSLHEKYHLADEQDAELVKLIADLFEKRLTVEALQDAILSRVKCDDKTTKQLIKEIFVNLILPLGDHFGDRQEYFFSTIGTQDDVNASKTLPVILRLQQEIIAPRLRALETVDYDQEALNVKKIFREQIVDLHASPDDNYKIALNGLIFDLLAKKSGYHLELIGEMLDNKETVGAEKIVRDNARYEPLATEWIRDLHAFSSPDEVTSLSIAKYISQSPNARKLTEKERETLKRLFETYYTLRHFPDSLTKIPPEQWMIIPYDPVKIPGGVAAPTFPPDEVLNGAQPSKALLSELLVSKASPRQAAATPVPSSVIPSDVQPSIVSSRPQSAEAGAKVDEAKGSVSGKKKPVSDSLASDSAASVTSHGIPDRPATWDVGNDSAITAPSRNDTNISSRMPPKDYEKSAGDIIVQCGFTLSPDIVSRLKTVIVTRLRNVRNDTQTKLRLMDAVAEGGIGLSSADAEKVLDGIKSESGIRNQESGKDVIPSDVQPSIVSSRPQSAEAGAKVDEAKGNDNTVESTPPPPSLAIKEDENGVPVVIEEQKPKWIPASAQQPSPAPPPPAMKGAQKIPVQVRPGSTVGKVPISDVKAPPRLLDAVGELRAMTIKDFRRLSPNPVEAAAKVTTKIQLLEKDSYTKKMAGIEAWKENEVSQLYRDIGKESFGAGLKMSDVIEKRKSEGKPYLTTEEFEALLDLNENIRV